MQEQRRNPKRPVIERLLDPGFTSAGDPDARAFVHHPCPAVQVEIQVKDLSTAEELLRQELAVERRRSSAGGCFSIPCANPAVRL